MTKIALFIKNRYYGGIFLGLIFDAKAVGSW